MVSYDIVCDRRRHRVAKLLEGYGERVQDSVFECWLEDRHLRVLHAKLVAQVDPECDRVRIYTICGRDVRDRFGLGVAMPTEDRKFDVL